MTLQDFKNLFENIAVKVVSHTKGQAKSQFLMVDDETAVDAVEGNMNTANYCMEVSYPIDEIRYEGTEHHNKPNFVFRIYRAVEKNDMVAQEIALQVAKEKLLEVASWLYCSQKANDGFGIIPGSSTQFDNKSFKMSPFIDPSNNLCGREVTFSFTEIINLYDASKINTITDLYT